MLEIKNSRSKLVLVKGSITLLPHTSIYFQNTCFGGHHRKSVFYSKIKEKEQYIKIDYTK